VLCCTVLTMLCCAVVHCATLQLPAGVIEKVETIEELAVRELKEETGMLHASQSWGACTRCVVGFGQQAPEGGAGGRGQRAVPRQAVFALITNTDRLCGMHRPRRLQCCTSLRREHYQQCQAAAATAQGGVREDTLCICPAAVIVSNACLSTSVQYAFCTFAFSGYVGSITSVTTEVANDQGLTNSCLNVSVSLLQVYCSTARCGRLQL
jgi:hypothetical protein